MCRIGLFTKRVNQQGNQNSHLPHSFLECAAKILVNFKKQIEVDSLMVADSALYTAANLQLLSDIKWLSRVPLSLAEAKRLVSSINDSELIKSQINGYSYVVKESSYASVKQRWLIAEGATK